MLTPGGKDYSESDIVFLNGPVKTVFLEGKRVLPLEILDDTQACWRTLSKKEIKEKY